MASISFGGQSLIIDGRRTWLVSGEIHYARMPQELWRSRIRAARQGGLNCISTSVFWNVHEPAPRKFQFEGDADLRRFVELIGEEGMYCVLRPGPYIGGDWDFGGLPPWLLNDEAMRLREANGPFLEACARYYGKVLTQVRELQVTSRGGGPIIMMQAENQWLCHKPVQGEKYLRELVRYLRENGCTVPINVCNNLWQRVDGALDTWSAAEHLAADLRQLRIVQPEAPPMVSEYWCNAVNVWGRPNERGHDADDLLERLAHILAVGGQYNVSMFHGGTNLGFYGGRTVGGPGHFATTSYQSDAPLTEAGGRTDKYLAVKRISTFASQFGHVFAHLDSGQPHIAVHPTDGRHPLSVIHQRGSQGEVVFMIKGPNDATTKTQLLLPNGLSLPVELGDDRVAWVLLDVSLGGDARLSYTNLRPWAFIDQRLLVLFGPAGSDGIINIDGAQLHVKVPAAGKPAIEQHEQLTIAVLSTQQVDTAYIVPDGLVVGAAALDEQDRPLPPAKTATVTTITTAGKVRSSRATAIRRAAAPKLSPWQQATVHELLDGQSDQYKPIEAPAPLEALDCPFGYGWYHLSIKAPKNSAIMSPLSGDRLHVYNDGKLAALLGRGDGAADGPAKLGLDGPVTVLADNLGRFSFGWLFGEGKGLLNHFYTTRLVRLAKPKVQRIEMPDPFEVGGCYVYCRDDQPPPVPRRAPPPRPATDALVWRFKPHARKPMVLDIRDMPIRAMILLNRQPFAMYDPQLSVGVSRHFLQVGEHITGGQNELRLALFEDYDPKLDVVKYMKLYQCTQNVSDEAGWRFAPWSVPAESAFGPAMPSRTATPCWHRCTFAVSHTDTPLWVEPRGMSKGQIILNGHNVGRYFIATRTGKAVGPQMRYYLPEPWLDTNGPNVLMLFDEHGKAANQCRLIYDPLGPYGQ